MKTALIRLLSLATLATSMTTFAAAEGPKHNESSTGTAKQANCNDNGKTKQKKTRTPETDQEKEFDRVLMSIYG